MIMNLFITEKKSVALDFAKALKMPIRSNKGYLEDGDNLITWCRGHLVAMSYPEAYDPELKNWSLDTLPFIPQAYRYEIIGNVQEQYKIVAELLNRKDVTNIYYAGDSAREGEYIQRLVRMMAGHNPVAIERRIWIDSQTDEEILRGIREAKNLSEYDSLSDSAYARAIEDYLIGMNFSRVLSLKYARIATNATGGKYHAIAVGRVMSCVLGMIVERERLIRNTKQVSFYSIQSDINQVKLDWKITEQSPYFHSPDNYNQSGLLNKVPVDQLVQQLNQVGTIQILENKESVSKKQAPLLFNLAELQAECAKIYKISPAQTLEIAQVLYEKKMTTYPRTDARVLTTAITKTYHENIAGLQNFSAVSDFADHILAHQLYNPEIMNRTKYVNDAMVSDHYAIIPTGQGLEEYDSLTELEKQVFTLICKRFLSIFYPAAEYKKRSITGTSCQETFNGSFTILVSPGFLEVTGYRVNLENEKMYELASRLTGEMHAVYNSREGKSKPPSRYTTGSMIIAMENAGNLIEDLELREQIKGSGIGTSATRAEVLSKLERIQYIKIDKKTQTITPDMFGEIVYDILKESIPQILNPQYTASWEKGLQGIVSKEVSKEYYLDKIYHYVSDGVNEMKNNDCTSQINQSIQNLTSVYPNVKPAANKNDLGISCPICGGEMKKSEKSYYCGNYKDGCKFSVWKTCSGKILPEAVIKDLILSWNGNCSKKSKVIKGFTSKAGKKFDASIQLSLREDGSVKTEFKF